MKISVAFCGIYVNMIYNVYKETRFVDFTEVTKKELNSNNMH